MVEMIVRCVHHQTEVIYQAKFDGAGGLVVALFACKISRLDGTAGSASHNNLEVAYLRRTHAVRLEVGDPASGCLPWPC